MKNDIETALNSIRKTFQLEAALSRREYVRRCTKLREFFRSNQYGYFDQNTGTWATYSGPAGISGISNKDVAQRAQSLYPLNFFQGICLSIISLLSGNKFTQKSWPKNVFKEQDVKKAKKADVVLKIFRKSDSFHEKLIKAIYFLCTDGTFASYIRTVTDGPRFGWIKEPIKAPQMVPSGPPLYKCVGCGLEAEESQGACTQCGMPMPPEPNKAPEMTEQMVETGDMREIPKARVIEDVVGGLELQLPPGAATIWDFLYLFRSRQVPRATIKALYPDYAKKPESGSIANNPTESLEVRLRSRETQGLTSDYRPVPPQNSNDVTFTEAWFHPHAFFEILDEKVRDEMLAQFPDGAYCAFANDVFLEARNERMTDHWRICHALPGVGQLREPILASIVPTQELINDMINIIRDIIEFTLPVTFVDNQVLDVERFAQTPVLGGGIYPVTSRGQNPVQNGFWQSQPGQLPQYATTLLDNLRTQFLQFQAGTFPAAYGGGTPGNNTAQGIEIERNSALGRIGLFLRQMAEHYTNTAPLVIENFKKTFTTETYTYPTPQGGMTTDEVAPEDLEIGEIDFEVDEEYPTTWPQRQANLMQMFANPLLQGIGTLIANADNIQRTLGYEELKVPGKDAYETQWQIIQKLVAEEPLPGDPMPQLDQMGQPVMDQISGQPVMVPGPDKPSVEILAIEDHPSMFSACVDFMYSDEGRALRASNSAGWQNFILHAEARQQAMMPPPAPPAMGGGAPSGAPPSMDQAPNEANAAMAANQTAGLQ